ncbi:MULTISPECIES: DedA family protein [unclassified Treponema]|uniref:DedA family protein n=1 Tax=unclassified Treponema TaxID=2638727 RepID=UPI0005301018|nr:MULTISPECIES: DedA family protein [unclassified Treponema]AIW90126.1 membrane protein [Treponema sp. OMZ 838]UTC49892.1 DedA family protein [Treponema sp. OMZ 855]
MFQTIAAWIGQYISYFPLVIFISLFLGGFNLPISEDIIVITAALLCKQEKASIPAFYAALYFGAVISDYLVYFWGWLLGRGRISEKFFSKLISENNIRRISSALERHGFLTFLFGRFIPFGIRNIISMTSGFVNFPFYKFAFFDAIAAVCNISALFWLVYFLGQRGSHFMKIIGIVLLLLFIGFSIYVMRSEKIFKSSQKKYNAE